MSGFKKQTDDILRNYISEFNTSPDFAEIRNLYKQNFDDIKRFIKNSNPKSAIEPISEIDNRLTKHFFETNIFIIIQQINGAIITNKLTLNDIK